MRLHIPLEWALGTVAVLLLGIGLVIWWLDRKR
jgi:hypothetical protein